MSHQVFDQAGFVQPLLPGGSAPVLDLREREHQPHYVQLKTTLQAPLQTTLRELLGIAAPASGASKWTPTSASS